MEVSKSKSGEKLFNELKALSTDEILQRLLDKDISMKDLRALAAYLDIKHERGMNREDLVDRVVKIGFANVRGYELLRKTKY